MTHRKRLTQDLRVQRTRKLLMEALIELIVEKGFLGTTVQDIADRAMVNRATFYRHYRDKYDLLDQYINQVYELTASEDELSSAQTSGKDSRKPPAGMVKMLEHVQLHADFYRVMLGAQGDAAFVKRIHQYSEMRLRQIYGVEPRPKSPPPELCLSYLSYAGIGVLDWWLNHGQANTPKQVAGWIIQLNKGTMSEVETVQP